MKTNTDGRRDRPEQSAYPNIQALYVMCSWCHDVSDASNHACPHCEHDLHRPRMECQCSRCIKVEDVTPCFLRPQAS